MKKISTVQVFRNEIFKEQKLTIGVDLGDRWSFYCVLDEAGLSDASDRLVLTIRTDFTRMQIVLSRTYRTRSEFQ